MHRILFLMLFLATTCFGQADSARTKRSDVFRFVDGVGYTFSSPVRWDGKDWLTLGGVIAGTTLLVVVDEPIYDFWLKQDSKFLDGVRDVGFHYGKPYSAYTFTAVFYATGLIFKDEWTRETGLMMGTTLLCSGLIQTAMKTAVGRARPASERGVLEFDPFNNTPTFHSFPSGHTTVSFAISFFIAKRFKSPVIKILSYTMAATTAVSRMYEGAHWFTDIAFGGVLGWFCAETAIKRISENKYRKERSDQTVSWDLSPYPGGLRLIGKF